MNLEGYAAFRRTVQRLTGIDLDCYKGAQMERRLQGMLRRLGVPDLNAYARLLSEFPGRVQEFRDFLSINVTEFFRNPERWEELKDRVLPEMISTRRPLRLWSAGCSTGAEPYSLAISMHELDPGGLHQIMASDIDADALQTAKRAVYTDKDLKEVSPHRRAHYFTRQENGWALRPEIRSRVRFMQQNLLSDPAPPDLDLILCRNVVIYFTESAKEELYRKFHAALKPGGILFVGGTESLLRGRELGFGSLTPVFYQKLPVETGKDPAAPLVQPASGRGSAGRDGGAGIALSFPALTKGRVGDREG